MFYSMTSSSHEDEDSSYTSGTYIDDTGVYSLSPAENIAYYAIDSTDLNFRIMIDMDVLGQKVERHSEDTDFTEETREIDGVSYIADIYPADEFNPEYTYCFTEDGVLAYIITAQQKMDDIDLGASTFKLKSITPEVDESVFSLEGYTIDGAPE